jgi:RNA polymerase sigma-70 factor (ECF subfamily)
MQGGGRHRSDEELVVAAQDGDSSALGELFGRHQKMLYSFARRYTANAEEAHDLVQETMLRALRNIGRFRGEARFATWLVAIVIRAALSLKRKEKCLQWLALDEQVTEFDRMCITQFADARPNPEQIYLQQELRSVLRREILRLHPRYRLVLQACVLEESPIEQVARSLGISPGAAKSRLHRARHSLSAALRGPGAACTRINIGARTA